MEKTCLKIPFSILQFTKTDQKAILLSRIHFFVKFEKFVILACKLLSFRIWHLAYPKLDGTPCTRPVHAPFELQGLALCTKPSDFGHLIFIGTQSQRNFLKSTILTTAYERHTELLWTNLNATFLRSLLVVHHLFQTSKSDLVTPLASSLLPNVKKWF